MAQTVKFLCLAGSVRTASYNRKLALAASVFAATAGVKTTVLEPREFVMPLYDGDLEERNSPPSQAIALKALFQSHNAIFIASPEYNASVSPFLKNAIDWVSHIKVDGEEPLAAFKNRVFAVGAVSPGGYGGMRGLIALRQVLELGLGAIVIPDQIALPGAMQAFNDDGGLKDERMAGMLKKVVAKLIDTSARLSD